MTTYDAKYFRYYSDRELLYVYQEFSCNFQKDEYQFSMKDLQDEILRRMSFQPVGMELGSIDNPWD